MVAACALLSSAVPASAGSDLCDELEAAELGGTITEPLLIELSGLAGSPQHDDVLWGHNDSGGAAEVYAMREDGTALGAYPITGAAATDYEDMASGPGPDGTGAFLYLGDIGDNQAVRPSVTVYRVREPETAPVAPGQPLEGAEAIELTYPGGPADAEALLVDPRTGDLVIVTKSLLGASRVFEADGALASGASVAMTDAGELRVPLPSSAAGGLPGTMVTGGDVSPDGSLVVLRTYRSVLVFERSEGQTVAEALLGQPCFGPQAEEPQGEAIAFTGDGSAYVTASEGSNVPLHRVVVRDAPVTTTTAVPPTTVAPSPDRDPEDGLTIGAAIVGAGVVLLVLGVGALYLARRRRSGAG